MIPDIQTEMSHLLRTFDSVFFPPATSNGTRDLLSDWYHYVDLGMLRQVCEEGTGKRQAE